MNSLLELQRLATTSGNRIPPPLPEPRRERRQREREQLRQMKRTADGSNIEVNQKRKRFHKACF